MNWILVLEIAVGIAMGIIVSVALMELTCCIADKMKNRKNEKSEDLLNPDNVTFTIESCRELGWISNGNEKAEEDTWF